MKTIRTIIREEIESLNDSTPKLIIPVGISGSGKSTWIRSNTDSNTAVVSPDDIRRELTGSVSDQSKNKEVFQVAFKRAENLLNQGKNVIFDATNVSSSLRKQMLDRFRENVDREFEALAKVFKVDPNVAKQRIKKDIEGGVDRSNVPDFAIDRQYDTLSKDLGSLEADGYKIIN